MPPCVSLKRIQGNGTTGKLFESHLSVRRSARTASLNSINEAVTHKMKLQRVKGYSPAVFDGNNWLFTNYLYHSFII